MTTVLLIVHMMIAAAMIAVVLLQRSEGGALGIGGGSGGFMTGRGAANFLTRVTAGLAAAFFLTSLMLSLIAGRPGIAPSLLGTEPATSTSGKSAPGGESKEPAKVPEEPAGKGGGILNKFEGTGQGGSRLPQSK